MTALLAVDGGQTTLRARVGERQADAPGPRRTDDPATLADAVLALWRELGSPPVGTVALGLSMLPAQPDDRAELAEHLQHRTGAVTVIMADDGITAHLGALPDLEGVSLTAGTGVACTGWMPGRPVTVVDGGGYLLGDEGGGFWIGREGLRAALRAHDGRGPATALTAAAEQRFGTLAGLPDRLHEDSRPADTIASFAVDVQRLTADPLAAGIVARAAAALRESAEAAARRTQATVVALGGRALTPGDPLHTATHTELAVSAYDFTIVDAAGTPLDGAERLAADLPEAFRAHLHIYSRTRVPHER
ncbi:MAG TPA: BadF/BadG/BcrA/BcrD ATPase family protein [Microbacterium sp.]|nr:BadF/BadG/BcrA/BcrD ATPase family protein [Microbacterium sp.]